MLLRSNSWEIPGQWVAIDSLKLGNHDDKIATQFRDDCHGVHYEPHDDRGEDRERDGRPKGARLPPSCEHPRICAYMRSRGFTRFLIPSRSSFGLTLAVSPAIGSIAISLMLPWPPPSSTLRRFTGDEYSARSVLDAIFDSNAMHRAMHSRHGTAEVAPSIFLAVLPPPCFINSDASDITAPTCPFSRVYSSKILEAR